jgi:hypothetical protein
MQSLIDRLVELKRDHFLSAVKGGTEVEAMTFDEIALMRRMSDGILPMTVKIGGPEARNDIDFMISQRIDYILAPMIESVYSLKNFVETVCAMDPQGVCKLAINIETVTAVEKLLDIFGSTSFKSVEKVTVGRSDLSASMNLPVDSPEVIRATMFVVSQARKHGKSTSVGGQINPENAKLIQNTAGSDQVNTRHMSVGCASDDIGRDVAAALEWEANFYKYLFDIFPFRRKLYLSRINSIESRIRAPALAV